MQYCDTNIHSAPLPFLNTLPGRWLQFALGILGLGFGIALMVRAEIGLGPWDVLHQGVSRQTGIPMGQSAILVGLLIMLLWLPLRQRPGIGTVLNIIFVGLLTDLLLALLPPLSSDIVPAGWLLPTQLVQMTAGIVVLGCGAGLYILAGLGTGPRDGVMMGLVERTGWSVRLIRTLIELVALAVGWLLGGSVGLGTVMFAVGIGPVIQYTLRVVRRWKGQPMPASAPQQEMSS